MIAVVVYGYMVAKIVLNRKYKWPGESMERYITDEMDYWRLIYETCDFVFVP